MRSGNAFSDFHDLPVPKAQCCSQFSCFGFSDTASSASRGTMSRNFFILRGYCSDRCSSERYLLNGPRSVRVRLIASTWRLYNASMAFRNRVSAMRRSTASCSGLSAVRVTCRLSIGQYPPQCTREADPSISFCLNYSLSKLPSKNYRGADLEPPYLVCSIKLGKS